MKEAFHQLLKIYDRKFLNLIAFFFHPPSLIILSQVSFFSINLFLLENHLVNCYEHVPSREIYEKHLLTWTICKRKMYDPSTQHVYTLIVIVNDII